MFTKSIAVDLIRHNIRVNSLCPGITRTPLLQAEVDNSMDPARTAAEQASWAPILRTADPREIAQGALFLASEDSSFAVGSCLVLDGGFTAREPGGRLMTASRSRGPRTRARPPC